MNGSPTCSSFWSPAFWTAVFSSAAPRLFIASLTLLAQPLFESAARAAEAAFDVGPILAQAGDNRGELERAIRDIPSDQQPGLEFLLQHMPTRDLQSLSADYLLENVAYAYRAWRESPWHAQVSEELFFNDILPYASINERRDRWRRDFYERFAERVKDSPSPGAAAVKLNQTIFPELRVKYSTRRRKADQSPYESIETGLASCSGLSILLIDACRAVGVPARFAGTPLWSDGSGNHSWVEVWDDGWHFTGAAEPAGDNLDAGWFTDRAAKAHRDDPRHAIFAVSFRQTPQPFPLVWDRSIQYVHAVNVTDRYAGRSDKVPEGLTQLMFRAMYGVRGDRCSAKIRVLDAQGQVVYEGQTKDERFDANDHLVVNLPKGQAFTVEAQHSTEGGEATARTRVEATGEGQLVTINLSSTVTTNSSTVPAAADTTDAPAEPEVAEGANLSEPLRALAEFLKTHEGPRFHFEGQAFAAEPLTREQSQQALALLWKAHARALRKASEESWKKRELAFDGHTMRFDYSIHGEKPATGRSLYLSMHGGGGAPPQVNDQQWENQKRLYQPEEGVYLSPRAPTDTWNLWHQGHVDPLFDQLIRHLIVLEDVNPDRVYLTGYSAGGDGVYQLAPRMADRFAAAAMMAGHPNEASPLGLRNLPFAIHMGALDGAFNRNEVARQWGQQLLTLQKDDPNGYPHLVKLHEGKGHWMDRQDAEAIPWMARHTRNPLPRRIVWRQDDVTHARFYWLAVAPEDAKGGAEVRAAVEGRQLRIDTQDIGRLYVRLHDELLDLDQPIEVVVNGQSQPPVKAVRTIATLARTLDEYGDPRSTLPAELEVRVP